jgi:hypothetical protein
MASGLQTQRARLTFRLIANKISLSAVLSAVLQPRFSFGGGLIDQPPEFQIAAARRLHSEDGIERIWRSALRRGFSFLVGDCRLSED